MACIGVECEYCGVSFASYVPEVSSCAAPSLLHNLPRWLLVTPSNQLSLVILSTAANSKSASTTQGLRLEKC